MTSLQTRIKQIPANDGYYINIGSALNTFYVNIGTDSAPQISTNIWARSTGTSTLLVTAGSAIFRDMGKTLTSSARVFRKVQLLVGSPLTEGVSGTPAGVGAAASEYLTGYIELPGTGGLSSGVTGSQLTPVARLG